MAAARPDDVYLIAQSNAGLPKWAQKQITYDGTPEVMAAYAGQMQALGVKYIGACCGSTPEHIAAMRVGPPEVKSRRAWRACAQPRRKRASSTSKILRRMAMLQA